MFNVRAKEACKVKVMSTPLLSDEKITIIGRDFEIIVK